MKSLISIFLTTLLLLSLALVRQTSAEQHQHSGNDTSGAVLVDGGTLWIDKTWVERDFFIVEGLIRLQTDRMVTDTLDVSGRYITPGFTDAHTHNLDRAWQRGYVDRYLAEGTLTILNLTSKSEGTSDFRKFLETRPSPEVRYSNWGFTSTLGHPFMAYEPYAMGLSDLSTWDDMADSISNSRLDLYNSYAFVDSVEKLETIWPEFLQTNPDAVKIYYFNESAIENRVPGTYGLRLEVAEAIIDSAKAAGLPVFVHVETRDEFEAMLNAGVDAIAHMPGYGWGGNAKTYDDVYLPDSILRKAAENNVLIIPTAALNLFIHQNDQVAFNAAVTFQTDLIRRYRSMGGVIAPGSDAFAQTAQFLYEYYAEHINIPAEDKLDMFTTESTRAILPDSQAGRLADGYKASFLVFNDRPFETKSWIRPERVFVDGKMAADNRGESDN